jgi:hypothetical protein
MGRREVAEENPLAEYSDDGLVAEAWSQGARQGVFAIEMTRRLMNDCKQSHAAENVGDKIWWLNFWLLVFTVVIAAMTAFCSGLALRTGG